MTRKQIFAGRFGDERRAKKGGALHDSLVAGRTCIVRKLAGGERAGTVAFGRFLASQDVTSAGIFDAAARDTAERAAGRSVIAIQDTTTLSIPNRRDGRLGPGPDGSTPSLLLHPVLTLDATSGVPLGLAGGLVWTRPKRRADDHTKRPIEKRELFRGIKLGLEARRQSVPDAGRQNGKAAKSVCPGLARLVRLDRRASGRLERLRALQPTRPQDHGRRLAPVQIHPPRLGPSGQCVNLVAPTERAAAPESVTGYG